MSHDRHWRRGSMAAFCLGAMLAPGLRAQPPTARPALGADAGRHAPAGARDFYRIIHRFGGPEGYGADKPPIEASDGNLYGTTNGGGDPDCYCGAIYRMSPAGQFDTLYQFTRDGNLSSGRLLQASDGAFYGTMYAYKAYSGCGSVFRMTADGTVTFLHQFSCGSDGGYPFAGVIQASDGNFYGTTSYGGAANEGVVYRMTPDGTLTVIHSFDSSGDHGFRGARPRNELLQASDGYLYGTTEAGGIPGGCAYLMGCGGVFRMTLDGTLTWTHEMREHEGGAPRSLIEASDGNLYGTTEYGGGVPACGVQGCGTVFRIAPGGKLKPVHRFSLHDGAQPIDLLEYTPGTLVGTTYQSARPDCIGCGILFTLTADGTFTTIHRFGPLEGYAPSGNTLLRDGRLIGVTSLIGFLQAGVMYELSADAIRESAQAASLKAR